MSVPKQIPNLAQLIDEWRIASQGEKLDVEEPQARFADEISQLLPGLAAGNLKGDAADHTIARPVGCPSARGAGTRATRRLPHLARSGPRRHGRGHEAEQISLTARRPQVLPQKVISMAAETPFRARGQGGREAASHKHRTGLWRRRIRRHALLVMQFIQGLDAQSEEVKRFRASPNGWLEPRLHRR